MQIPPLVSAQWLHENLDNPSLIVLDATLAKPMSNISALPHADKQIPGSHFFDIDHQFSNKDTDLPHMMCDESHFQKAARSLGIDQKCLVVVYDRHGVYSSPRAWWMLKSMGLSNVAVLDGGLPEWIACGFSTEQSNDGIVPSGDFQPSFDKSCFVDASTILSSIDDEEIQVMDARSSGRFHGTEPEPRAGLRSGHIPNSISLPFTEVLQGTKMKTKEELSDIFSSLLPERKKLIFSCGSGLTACIILLAAHLAGHEHLAVYDGSWSEWGQENEWPVVRS